MKGKMRKLFAFALAAIMVLAMGITASAQTVPQGATEKSDTAKITIENASKGETYTVYKIFDATVGSGSDHPIAYTFDGVLPKDNGFFVQDEKTGKITVTEAAVSENDKNQLSTEAIEWLKTNFVKEDYKVADAVSDGSELQFLNLPFGYYLVTSTLNNTGVVTVTSTRPEAEVVDKNTTTPTWDGKTSDKDSAKIGETVTFTLKINTQNYVKETVEEDTPEGKVTREVDKQIKEYVVKDNLADGAFGAVTIKSVKVIDPKSDPDNDPKTPTYVTPDPTYTVDGTSKNFPITIKWVEGSEATGWKSLYRSGCVLEIVYEATLLNNEKTIVAGNGNVNKASFSWNYTDNTSGGKNDEGEDTNTTEKTVYTYALAIRKIDPNGNTLQGAKFTVSTGTGNDKKDIYVKGTKGNYVNYELSETEIESLPELPQDVIKEVEVDDNGLIVIKGVSAGTYDVTEVVAPKGYNKLDGSTPVTAVTDKEIVYTNKITQYWKFDDDGNKIIVEETEEGATKEEVDLNTTLPVAAINVINETGVLLPSTGGIGTTIFYVVGGILVVVAGVLLITKKRMSGRD